MDEQLNISLPSKRPSIPACDHPSKSTAAVLPSSSLVRTDDPHHHQHVASSCDTSTSRPQQISNTAILSDDLKSTSPQQPPPECGTGTSRVSLSSCSSLIFPKRNNYGRQPERLAKENKHSFLHMSSAITKSISRAPRHVFALLARAS